jgi:hypothetical protein
MEERIFQCHSMWLWIIFRMISDLAFGEMIVISVCCYSVQASLVPWMDKTVCINYFKSAQKHKSVWRRLKIRSSQRKYFSTFLKNKWRNINVFWHIFKAETNYKQRCLIPLSIFNQKIVLNNWRKKKKQRWNKKTYMKCGSLLTMLFLWTCELNTVPQRCPFYVYYFQYF